MGDTQNDNIIRPILLADAKILGQYRLLIRRILGGLAGQANIAALAAPGGEDAEAVLCPSVEYIQHPAINLWLLKRQNRMILLDKLAKFRPTIIHAFWPGCADLPQFLSAQLGIPYVLTFLAPVRRINAPAVEQAYTGTLIGPSETIYQSLIHRWPRIAGQIEKVHIGSFVENSCACFRSSNRRVSLITVEKLDNAALFEPILRTMRHLLLDGFELELAILGQGTAEWAIRRKVREMRLTQTVTIVPPMRSLRTIFSGADIFIHLRDTGRFNITLLEAVGAGLVPAGCPDETTGLMEQNKTAAIFDPADNISIYDCLGGLLGRRELGRQMALEGQKRLGGNYSVSGMLEKLMQIYRTAQAGFASADRK